MVTLPRGVEGIRKRLETGTKPITLGYTLRVIDLSYKVIALFHNFRFDIANRLH
jgi:hypothetical protein